ncbi:hypothetical protein [Flavobacterium sp.]|uniref:hypothetical protein n=1 Tax=Flavobacterium sp. TaxID=239 RepID=UPI003526CAD1
MSTKLVNKQNAIIKYFFFIINPLFGLFVSLRDLKSESSYKVFMLFAVLFGICFTVPSGRTSEFTGDGAVYRLRFDRSAAKSSNDFNELVTGYFAFDEGEKTFILQQYPT